MFRACACRSRSSPRPERRRRRLPSLGRGAEEGLVGHDESMRMLEAIAKAFDEHDLDGIMVHFADDAVFEGPRGSEPWGTRFDGAAAIREAFAARFAGIPDVRYQQDEHF